MNSTPQKNIEKITLQGNETILFALKKMDILERKLLIIIRDRKFIGLVSIGDIQRAIIKNMSMETQVIEIIRNDIRVTYSDENIDKVKAEMIECRIECMPVLDK
jgi:CBS domain-containing protein